MRPVQEYSRGRTPVSLTAVEFSNAAGRGRGIGRRDGQASASEEALGASSIHPIQFTWLLHTSGGKVSSVIRVEQGVEWNANSKDRAIRKPMASAQLGYWYSL